MFLGLFGFLCDLCDSKKVPLKKSSTQDKATLSEKRLKLMAVYGSDNQDIRKNKEKSQKAAQHPDPVVPDPAEQPVIEDRYQKRYDKKDQFSDGCVSPGEQIPPVGLEFAEIKRRNQGGQADTGKQEGSAVQKNSHQLMMVYH